MRALLRTVAGLSLSIAALAGAGGSATACADLDLPLDESMQSPNGFGDFLTRDTTLFMIRGLLGPSDRTVADRGDRWIVDCEALTPDVRAALSQAVAFDGTLDPRAVREAFESRYLKTIAVREHDSWVKTDVAGLRAATHFRDWPQTVVPRSNIKQKTRRIFRSPPGYVPQTSVSQTLDSVTGDTAAAVLETEVATERENGIDWDFYAYNRAGNLVDYSTFPAGQRPSPRICIGCHYDGGTRGVGRFFPEGE
jgi:hypothetical protein